MEQIATSLGSVNDFALNTSANGTVLYQVNSTHLSVGAPEPDDVETVSILVDSSMCILLCTYVRTYADSYTVGCMCLYSAV